MADNVSILEPSVAPTGLALSKSGAKDVGGVKYQRIVLTTDVSGAQTDVGGTNALPVSVDVLGAKNDALVTDPTASASPIAILKGLLSGVGSRADAATVDPAAANTTNSFVALLKGLLLGFGTKADAAVSDPAAAGSFIAFIKGLLSVIGAKADALATNTLSDPQSAMSLLKTIAQRAQVPVIAAGENHIGEVSTRFRVPSVTITRPADTAAYTKGDVIAESTTVATVNAAPKSVEVARVNGGTGRITKARITKSGTSLSASSYRVLLFREAPTLTNGDNGAFISNKAQAFIGEFVVNVDRSFTDGAKGFKAPLEGNYVGFECATGSKLLYPVLVADGDYTPISGETFILAFEVEQD